MTIVNEDTENVLLSVCADGWSGASNIATLNADGQELTGIIMVGDDSQLTLNLTNGSTFTGCIDGDIQNAKGTTVSTEVGTVVVKLDSSSTWELTADTYITSFEGDASSVISNGYTDCTPAETPTSHFHSLHRTTATLISQRSQEQ